MYSNMWAFIFLIFKHESENDVMTLIISKLKFTVPENTFFMKLGPVDPEGMQALIY